MSQRIERETEPTTDPALFVTLRLDGAGPVVAIEGEAVLDDRDRILRMHVAEVALNGDPGETSDEPADVLSRHPAPERASPAPLRPA